MKARDKYYKTNNWKQKVIIINVYHSVMSYRHNDKWNMKLTAKYFGISIALVSECVKLYRNWDLVKSAPSRRKALAKLG